MTEYFDFIMRESSITIPEYQRGNLCWSSCKYFRNVGLGATVQLQACQWNWLIFGVKIGFFASPILPSIICLGSRRLFFEIVSAIGTSALTSRLFQKSELLFAQIRNIFDRFEYLFIKNDCIIVGSGKIVSIKWINYKIF